jgi:oligogalacturonide lyase
MNPFNVYKSETKLHTDRVTGVNIKQLTSWKGHSTHPYFTEDGWYGNDTKMLMMSDRNNVRNIHSICMESGEISRLTDMPSGGPDISSSLAINKQRNEVYFMYQRQLFSLDISTLETRILYTTPDGYNFAGTKPMACGKRVVGALKEDLSGKVYANTSAGYIGMRETFQANPKCSIICIDVETGKVDEIWNEDVWLGHVNPSPTQPNLLTFCHEGPWNLVDHRIWLLDINTGNVSKLRERKAEGELVGHEYWFMDGLHVGYQCHSPQPKTDDNNKRGETWFGYVKYDGTGEVEADECKHPRSTPDHIHSLDEKTFCSDTGKSINIFRNDGGKFDGPRTLCMHDGAFFWGGHHPHPRVTRDGKWVVYNSNCLGYCNIYMAEIPEDFGALPKWGN